MHYRRVRVAGGSYFFTIVTFNRAKILTCDDNVGLLRRSLRRVMGSHPFRIDAFVLLPDHFHCIWTLPGGDADFSTRWRLIKSIFTRNCKDRSNHVPLGSRQRKKEQAVWQRRFWEHRIRDERDFIKHVEYIHYNPVRHNYAAAPEDWPFSSFHKFVRQGKYARSWSADVEADFVHIANNVGWVE